MWYQLGSLILERGAKRCYSLIYNLDENSSCCTRTDLSCQTEQDNQCSRYDGDDDRYEATAAVYDSVVNNENFYNAFRLAWFKATTNGMKEMRSIEESCASQAAR